MTELEYFRILAPALASITDEAVGVWIGIAECSTNTWCLNDEQKAMANALYAAHLIETTPGLSPTGGGAGQVKSEKEGDLQITYGSIDGQDTFLGSTAYGLKYLDLTKAYSGSGILTRMGNGCHC